MAKRKSFRVKPSTNRTKGAIQRENESDSDGPELSFLDDRVKNPNIDAEEEVLNLDLSEDSEGDKSGSDEEDDGELSSNEDSDNDQYGLKTLVQNLPPKLRQRVMMGKADEDDSSSGEDEEEDEDSARNADIGSWGKNKQTYWTGDTADLEIGQEFEDAEVEEAAATEQFQKNLRNLKESDFFGDFDEDQHDSTDEDDEYEINRKGEDGGKSSSSAIAALERIVLGPKSSDVIHVEAVRRDVSKLSKEQRLALLEAESPELLSLVRECEEKDIELRQRIVPASDFIQKIIPFRHPSIELLSFIQVKRLLLESYTINMTFYLYLKSLGKQTSSHPVMKQLLDLRYLMERCRPMDKFFGSKIEDILSLSKENLDSDEIQSRVEELAVNWIKEEGSDEETEEEGGEEEEEDASDPDEDSDYDTPREQQGSDAEEDFEANDDELQRQMDEAVFEGSAIPSASKKSSKAVRKIAIGLEDVGEFQDELNFSRIGGSGGGGRPASTADALEEALQSAHGQRRTAKKSVSINDDEMPSLPDPAERKRAKKLLTADDGEKEYEDLLASNTIGGEKKRRLVPSEPMDDVAYPGGDGDEEDDGNLFEQFAKKKKEFLDKKKAHFSAEKKFSVDDTVREGGKRAISYEIMKNKGLTPHRKKENRNARVKKRKAYDKAVKARKGQVREVIKGAGSAYGGEMTGIKANIARSRKITN